MSADLSQQVEDMCQEKEDNKVCTTYVENFMKQVQSLPAKRPSVMRSSDSMSQHCKFAESLASEVSEPDNIQQAWQGEHGRQWRAATGSGYKPLVDTNTWDLVPLPDNKNVVGCKWIFKVKRKADNTIDRFKARLVAQRYTQEQGVDFNEVFAPVARFTTIRTVLAT